MDRENSLLNNRINFKNDRIAWDITTYLLDMGYLPDDGYECVMDWLALCTNLKAVSFDVSKYDDSLLYCGCAWDYAKEQTAIWEAINFKLIQFNYAWCAFETLIDVAIPDEYITKNHAKIKGAISFIKSNINTKDIPSYWFKAYERLITDIIDIEQFKYAISKLGIAKNSFYPNDNLFIPISVVYKVRNFFAHGTLKLPMPDDEESECFCITPDTIEISTGIVLMAIIMILIVLAYEYNTPCEEYVFCEELQGKKPIDYLKDLFSSRNLE